MFTEAPKMDSIKTSGQEPPMISGVPIETEQKADFEKGLKAHYVSKLLDSLLKFCKFRTLYHNILI